MRFLWVTQPQRLMAATAFIAICRITRDQSGNRT